MYKTKKQIGCKTCGTKWHSHSGHATTCRKLKQARQALGGVLKFMRRELENNKQIVALLEATMKETELPNAAGELRPPQNNPK